ncbi:unnamed protein product [Thlaspi arvense]|uniref:Uncharacterized protein n=1 Tax=Thlaspi arvense TaxID=13288 RepID=A0AAU9SH76_THLAR|nr:unnamed protein product [Thlaspi arvense]
MRLTGKAPSRAEFFIESRTKPDGSFICEKAKTCAEELTKLLCQNSQVINNVPARLDDEYARVFGPERPGRIRGVGRGPTPSTLARRSAATRAETENSEVIVQLQEEVKGFKDQATAWTSSFAVAFGNIPNPTFANMPTLPNPQEMDDGAN